MATDIKELSRRILEEVWNNQNLDAVDEMIAPNFVQHDPQSPIGVRGIEGYKQFVRYYLNAFPDCHFTVEDVISDGQTVVTRWTVTSTHTGNLGPIPATGQRAIVTGMSCSRVENGKFVESWTNWDTLGMMQQLGVLPALAERAA
jgi:steroid delta-isomerase-like uncharacterized protein